MPPVPLGVRARVQAVNLGIGAIQRSGPCLSHNPQQRPEGEGGRVRTLAAVAAMPLVVRVVRRTPYGTGRMLHDQLWHRSQRGPAVRGMGCMLCDGVRCMLRTTCHVHGARQCRRCSCGANFREVSLKGDERACVGLWLALYTVRPTHDPCLFSQDVSRYPRCSWRPRSLRIGPTPR